MTFLAAPLSLGHGNDIRYSLYIRWSNLRKSSIVKPMSNIHTQSLHDALEVSLSYIVRSISEIALHFVGCSGAAYGSFSDSNQIDKVTEGNQISRFCRKYVFAAICQPSSAGISIALDGK